MYAPGFPHFYYMLGANQGFFLYGEVSVMTPKTGVLKIACSCGIDSAATAAPSVARSS